MAVTRPVRAVGQAEDIVFRVERSGKSIRYTQSRFSTQPKTNLSRWKSGQPASDQFVAGARRAKRLRAPAASTVPPSLPNVSRDMLVAYPRTLRQCPLPQLFTLKACNSAEGARDYFASSALGIYLLPQQGALPSLAR